MTLQRKLSFAAGFMAVLLGLVAVSRIASAQGMTPIAYGDTVDGEVKNSKTEYARLYEFTAEAGDVVAATMVRTSGNLRPNIVLVDPSKRGAGFILAESDLSADGKSATLDSFTLEVAGNYVIFATREKLDTGTTTGKFELTFEKVEGDPSVTDTPPDLPTDTPVPAKKPTSTPKPKPRATPTAKKPKVNVDTFAVGSNPTYSIWSGNNLYVANYGSSSVSILDENGQNLSTFSVAGVPFTLGWDGVRLWVADIGTAEKPGASVLIYDARGKKLSSFKVGKEPYSFSFDQETGRMWIALFGENKVVALDFKGNLLMSVDVSEAGNNPNTVYWAGDRLWVTLTGSDDAPGNTVISIDGDGNITGTYSVGKFPADLAWDDASQTIWVANYGDGTVTALNTDGKTLGTYPVGKNPGAVVWAQDHLWVSLAGDDAVAVFDSEGKQITKIPLGFSPNGIAYDGASTIWIALQGTTDKPGNSVGRIDVNSALDN